MNVLIGVDGSDDASHAVRFVQRLLHGLAVEDGMPRHAIVLYHSCRLPYVPSGDYDFMNGETYVELREAIIQRAQDVLKDEAATFAGSDVQVKTHHDFAVPAQGLADLARAQNSDLIVVGTRGLTGLKRIALGSVSQRISELAPCSVLIVRQPKEAS